jgi:hypothetical protein
MNVKRERTIEVPKRHWREPETTVKKARFRNGKDENPKRT